VVLRCSGLTWPFPSKNPLRTEAASAPQRPILADFGPARPRHAGLRGLAGYRHAGKECPAAIRRTFRLRCLELHAGAG
jgi:hypothetical protein